MERQSWYTQLVMYAAPPPTAALTLDQLALDPDKHLLSHTVEKVVLVKLKGEWVMVGVKEGRAGGVGGGRRKGELVVLVGGEGREIGAISDE